MSVQTPDESLGPTAAHSPVMLAEVLAALAPADDEVIVDGTFGAGGYTTAILVSSRARVLAFDRDPTAIAAGQSVVERFAPRLSLVEATFGDMAGEVERHPWFVPQIPADRLRPWLDGVVLDIGVSSMQLDVPGRGFSFQRDGPLDMRMSASGRTAADIVNTTEQDELADLLFQYGEERRSRAIARAIVKRRQEAPFSTTLELADVVARVLGRGDDGRHPATRTFQALRIVVNDELGELSRGLSAAEALLKPGGRLVIVTFHSLEDRIVKQFLTDRSGRTPGASRHVPSVDSEREPSLRLVNRRPLTPSQPELDANPRARSARLRAAIRTDAPPPS